MPPDQLARVFADAGAKEEVVAWTRKFFECPVCKATIKPGLPRPAAARRQLEFNKTVGTDHFTHKWATKEFDFLNILCWGTNKMIIKHAEDKLALHTRRRFMEAWIKPFGFMEVLVVDQGPEFLGEEFWDFFMQHGVLVHFSDGQSPWQNGPTERAGGTFKELLDKVIQEYTQ